MISYDLALSVAYGVFAGGIALAICKLIGVGFMSLVRKFNAWDADKE